MNAPTAPPSLLLRVATGLLVVAAAWAAWQFWQYHVRHPATNDLYLEADILKIAPRVSGPLVAVHLVDNQHVAECDLLFEIDPTDFQQAVDAATANLARAKQQFEIRGEAIKAAEDIVDAKLADMENRRIIRDRARKLLEAGAGTQAEFDNANAGFRTADADLENAKQLLEEARIQRGTEETNPEIQAARTALAIANLQLGYTQVRAPVAGYVTNLNLPVGSYVTEGLPQVVLVKDGTWRATANFRETDLRRIQLGQKAVVHLKLYPGQPIEGSVEGIAWAVAQEDLSDGSVPVIAPTVDWVRLAMRFPVRIRLSDPPPDRPFRVGASGHVRILNRP